MKKGKSKRKSKEIKDLAIDADHILHLVASDNASDALGGIALEEHVDIKFLKKKFKMIVQDYEDVVATEIINEDFSLGKTRLFFSDPMHNFRFKVFPAYKKKRPPKSADFYALRAWAHKKYGIIENAEADDAVAHYVRKGAVGLSTDKDLLKGVPGWWYDAYHRRQYAHYTTPEAAELFSVLQSVAGDLGDGIPGIYGVALITAEKLLAGDLSWESVVRVYESKELTVVDALITKRLTDLTQWTPKRGVRLWQPPR